MTAATNFFTKESAGGDIVLIFQGSAVAIGGTSRQLVLNHGGGMGAGCFPLPFCAARKAIKSTN